LCSDAGQHSSGSPVRQSAREPAEHARDPGPDRPRLQNPFLGNAADGFSEVLLELRDSRLGIDASCA
jgi:hypothetical protein